MKLALRQTDGFAVLDVLGEVDAHQFAVLKAGLTKLLANGKNRIVLHVIDARDLPSEVLREIALLDLTARELSGRIVIASPMPELKEKVKAFAKPPVISILASVEKAIEYSRNVDLLEGEEAGETADELAKRLAASEQKVAGLEAQLRLASSAEAPKLRAENAALAQKVRLLEAQVAEYAKEHRAAQSAEGFREQIETLEQSLRKLGHEKVKR